jgi:hypothetical protein
MLTVEQNTALQTWLKAKNDADVAKAEELRLRNEATALCFTDAKVGTNSLDLGKGYVAKMVKKETFKFVIPEDFELPPVPGDNDPKPPKVSDALEALAEEMRQASNEGPFIFDRLVKLTYDVSVTEYKALSPTMKKIVDKYIETKFGTPTLEIKEPPKAKDA